MNRKAADFIDEMVGVITGSVAGYTARLVSDKDFIDNIDLDKITESDIDALSDEITHRSVDAIKSWFLSHRMTVDNEDKENLESIEDAAEGHTSVDLVAETVLIDEKAASDTTEQEPELADKLGSDDNTEIEIVDNDAAGSMEIEHIASPDSNTVVEVEDHAVEDMVKVIDEDVHSGELDSKPEKKTDENANSNDADDVEEKQIEVVAEAENNEPDLPEPEKAKTKKSTTKKKETASRKKKPAAKIDNEPDAKDDKDTKPEDQAQDAEPGKEEPVYGRAIEVDPVTGNEVEVISTPSLGKMKSFTDAFMPIPSSDEDNKTKNNGSANNETAEAETTMVSVPDDVFDIKGDFKIVSGGVTYDDFIHQMTQIPESVKAAEAKIFDNIDKHPVDTMPLRNTIVMEPVKSSDDLPDADDITDIEDQVSEETVEYTTVETGGDKKSPIHAKKTSAKSKFDEMLSSVKTAIMEPVSQPEEATVLEHEVETEPMASEDAEDIINEFKSKVESRKIEFSEFVRNTRKH